MNDRYLDFANSGVGHWLTGVLGLPQPVPLDRDPARVLRAARVADAGEGRLGTVLSRELEALGITRAGEGDVDALIVDASGVRSVAGTQALYAIFNAQIRSVRPNGRILLLATNPDNAGDEESAAIFRGMEGFLRSIAKEARKAIAADLVYIPATGEPALGSTLAFFLSGRSAYVSGQVVRVGAAAPAAADRARTILVTGASRGIGAAIVESFARAGANVVGLDMPGTGAMLELDITAPDAGARLVADARERGGYDVVVHNAGITRDKTIARMDADRWNAVMAVNLAAPMRTTAALLEAGQIRQGGRIVAVSSLSGIAGNVGQSNYAFSKAGVIGWIQRLAREVAAQGITANAVAPGFIETQMTAAIPFTIREAGRRMNAMGQGGQPEDVAETIAWLADPGSAGISGAIVRVCGQSLLGA
jgi:3-oxoacyl-[acyl-carrier protein] reductase